MEKMSVLSLFPQIRTLIRKLIPKTIKRQSCPSTGFKYLSPANQSPSNQYFLTIHLVVVPLIWLIAETKWVCGQNNSRDKSHESSHTSEPSPQLPSNAHKKNTPKRRQIIHLHLLEQNSKQQIHLGRIPSHQTRSIDLEIKNGRDRGVTLTDIETDCGCLKTEIQQSVADPGESLQCRIQLAPSNRSGLLRRQIAFRFAEESLAKFDLSIDAEIVSPLSLQKQQIDLPQDANQIHLTGIKDDQTTILDCQAVRGTLRVKKIDAQTDSFKLTIDPLLRFGRSSDLLRFRIKRNEIPLTVDLPIEVNSIHSARFLPSTAILRWVDNQAELHSRLVLLPRHSVNLDQLSVRIETLEPTPFKMVIQKAQWVQQSAVLVELKATLKQSFLENENNSNIGTESSQESRLVVFTPKDPAIAILSLIHSRSEPSSHPTTTDATAP